MIVIIFLIQSLWVVGIHGASIIGAVLTPVYLLHMEMNATQGTAIPLAGEFMSAFAYNGGSGATLGLVIMMTFMAKSEQYKMLGKASIVPGIFQINEPIIFGLPMVYNPHYLIPFIISPMVSGTIAYFAITSGIVRPVIAMQPWPTPPLLNGFIATGGDWKGALLSVICVLANTLIYYPFFKKRDNELYREQLASEGVAVEETTTTTTTKTTTDNVVKKDSETIVIESDSTENK